MIRIHALILTVLTVLTCNAAHLSVRFLACGHGDAALIRTPDRRSILIDCGPPNFGKSRLPGLLRHAGATRLDHLFLTHAHDDHIGGWTALMKTALIRQVWEPGFANPSGLYRRILRDCHRKNIRIHFPVAGQQITAGSGVSITVLSPTRRFFRYSGSDLNNNSLALLLEYKTIRFLFTADMERPALARLLTRHPQLRCDVVKVPHHGSKTGLYPGMYRRLRPRIAVLSGGYDKFPAGPDRQVLAALANANARILSTFSGKDIVVITDGKRILSAGEKGGLE